MKIGLHAGRGITVCFVFLFPSDNSVVYACTASFFDTASLSAHSGDPGGACLQSRSPLNDAATAQFPKDCV